MALYEAELGIPVTDAISRPAASLVAMVVRAFPERSTERPRAA
jgi:hypothetical protein